MQNEAPARPSKLPKPIAHHTSLVLYKLNTWLQTEMDKALEPSGIKMRHYSVLSVLAYKGPMSQQQVGEKLRIDRATIVAIIDDLERLGYLERRRSAEDRRRYDLMLTDAGQREVERAERDISRTEAALFSPLDAGERETLHRLLSALMVGGDPS